MHGMKYNIPVHCIIVTGIQTIKLKRKSKKSLVRIANFIFSKRSTITSFIIRILSVAAKL